MRSRTSDTGAAVARTSSASPTRRTSVCPAPRRAARTTARVSTAAFRTVRSVSGREGPRRAPTQARISDVASSLASAAAEEADASDEATSLILAWVGARRGPSRPDTLLTVRKAAVLTLAVVLAARLGAGQTEVRRVGEALDVRATAAPVSEVLDRIARETGMKVTYD